MADVKMVSLKDVVGGGDTEFWRFKGRYRVCKGSRASKKSKTTALNLISRMMRYPEANLLVVRTFSKSRSLAGARIGYAMAQPALIDDLERVRNSFHPYNINRLSMVAGVEGMKDRAYFEQCCRKIMNTRQKTAEALKALGFTLTESATNFHFASPNVISGKEYYEKLKERGVLVRYFGTERLSPYVRITIGTDEEMNVLLNHTREILKEANP